MKELNKTYGVQELSSKELKSIDGGYNIIEYIAMGIGYLDGVSDAFWESYNFETGYVGSKM